MTARRRASDTEPTASRRSVLKASMMAAGAAAIARPLAARGAATTAANSKLNLAVVGCGGQGRGDMKGLISHGANLVALCDPDAAQIDRARADAKQAGGDATRSAKAYENFHRLIDDADSFDAVLIATPDHWHAPLCTAFIKAGKPVYCEKPLTHSVSEARDLRELVRTSKVVTQMGNQGSASASARRCIEVIKGGALGRITDIYYWGIGVTANEGSAPGEDPIPAGFNWDLWVGPSAMRPFRSRVYHPATWRGWFDFGNGGMADFCCHAMNMPMRALDLSYPDRLILNMTDGRQIPGKPAVDFHFPARGKLPPLTFHWYGNVKPPAEVLQPLVDVYKNKVPDGVMIIGELGCIYTSHWNTGGLIRLNGEARLTDVTRHPGTAKLPQFLPRTRDHGLEWMNACRGQGQTFSPFEIGGKLTEIGLSGVVAIRARKSLDWDGENMRATNAPEADKFVHTPHRPKWLA